MDMHHLRNLTYVDVYLTDRFSQIGKKTQQIFKNKMLRNLMELEIFLTYAPVSYNPQLPFQRARFSRFR
jgi:hypothetical protein